jgi:hypothetical protein
MRHQPSPRPVAGFIRILPRDDLQAAVALADFYVILVPLSPEAQRIVNRSVISALMPSAYLINVGFGRVIDETTLIKAPRGRQIARGRRRLSLPGSRLDRGGNPRGVAEGERQDRQHRIEGTVGRVKRGVADK